MRDHLREAIRQKLGDAFALLFPELTPRDASTANLEGTFRTPFRRVGFGARLLADLRQKN